jgi:hypothetical protein
VITDCGVLELDLRQVYHNGRVFINRYILRAVIITGQNTENFTMSVLCNSMFPAMILQFLNTGKSQRKVGNREA